MDYVTRASWGALPPKRDIPPFIAFNGLTIHHSASQAPALHQDCPASVRGIQHYQMVTEGVYDDIAYSWVVCPHGTIYEGRGWNHHDGANGAPSSAGYSSPAGPGTDANYYYPAACVLGSSPQATAGVSAALIAIRQTLIGLHPQATEVWPHSRIVPDQCPGDPLRAWIAGKSYETTEAEMILVQKMDGGPVYNYTGGHIEAISDHQAQRAQGLGAKLVKLNDTDEIFSLSPPPYGSAPAPVSTTVPAHAHPVSVPSALLMSGQPK